VSHSNFYDKGQAFVVFKNVQQASKYPLPSCMTPSDCSSDENMSHVTAAAMKKLQGYELEGQQLRVAFARRKSHAVQKLEGTYAVSITFQMQMLSFHEKHLEYRNKNHGFHTQQLNTNLFMN
jgi:hypothetical protein